VRLRKADPTNYFGSLSLAKRLELNRALKMALDLRGEVHLLAHYAIVPIFRPLETRS